MPAFTEFAADDSASGELRREAERDSVPDMPSRIRRLRLLIADDHVVVRLGLVSMLSLEENFKIVAEAEHGEQAVAAYREHQPDVALFDVRMPGVDGLEALRRVRAEFPRACVLMLSTSELEDELAHAADAGAMGYLPKTSSQEELVEAIRGAARGEAQFTATMRRRLAERSELTPRELEVLRGLGRGLANKEIADLLQISEHTVKTYVKTILAKLHVADRTGAVAAGFERGFLKLA